MRYPCLVPKHLCKTDIHILIESEDISEDGSPITIFEGDLKCNYQDSAKKVLTNEQKIVQISGTALIPFDFVPALPVISGGVANVFGVERRIATGQKNRNPDGTVNFVRLELI